MKPEQAATTRRGFELESEPIFLRFFKASARRPGIHPEF